MRFNDHIRDYLEQPDLYDEGAASARLMALIQYMLALRYGRGFMTAVRNVCAEVRKMCRASEQASRYAIKLRMLRTQAWREAVFEQLGGARMMDRWGSQPFQTTRLERTARILSEIETHRRERIKLCAKATAHPNIFRDPCRLDEEGLFRLAPVRRQMKDKTGDPRIIIHDYSYDPRPLYKVKGYSSPITVWPEEFSAFERHEEEAEKEAEKETKRLAAPLKKLSYDACPLRVETFMDIPKKVPIPVPP